MKIKTLRNLLTLSLLAVGIQAVGQVGGTVSDAANGEPLAGANVNLKGTQIYAVTGKGGKYQIEAEANDTLVFSFIGLQTREEPVGRRSVIDVRLEEDKQHLNEIVVVGYGAQRRRELTGAIAGISAAQIEFGGAGSIDELLGGAVAGVNVTQNSGQPGAGSSTRIRGGNSINASNEPLYVIDGFIFFSEKNATQAGVANIDATLNPLASINPADIESVEILKDISAKAIYGSRGANGVIIVTTRKGQRSGNTVRYQYTAGVDKRAKKLPLFDARQWGLWARSVPLNNGDEYLSDAYLASIGKGYDWQDAALQNSLSHTHELSLNGGGEDTRYLISGSYTDRQGIVLNSGFKRYNGRINLERTMFKHLTVGVTASADRSEQNAMSTMVANDFAGSSSPFKAGISNSLVYALFMPPVLPIYSAAGDYNYTNPFELTELHYYERAANPVSDLKNSIAQTLSTTLLANFSAKYRLPAIEGLALKINAGTNINHIAQNFFAPPYTALGINEDIQGRAAIGNRRTDVTQTEYLLTFTRQLNEAHFVDILGGYTLQRTGTTFVYSKVTHIDRFDNLARSNAPSTTVIPPASRTDEAYLHSAIARLNYTLLHRYNLTATFRADKSSRFPAGHTWGYFPSAGISWNISDEPFFARRPLPALSSLKLRATAGASGNQEIGFNDYVSYFNVGRYNGEAALEQSVISNPNLKWETTAELNAGIDAGLWNERLAVSFDIYTKKTFDLLMKVPPPIGSGTGDLQTVNLGNITNGGVELSLAATLVDREKASLKVNANIARNINTITDLGQYNNLTEGSSQEQILRVGQPAGAFYGYIYDGVVQATDDLTKLPAVAGTTPKAGDIKLRDISGADGVPDGKITPEHDRTVVGSTQPDFTYGLSAMLNLHGFDLFVSLQGSQGNEVYNKLRRHLSENNSTYNRSAELLDAWTEERPSNTVPAWNSVVDANTIYSRYIENASYLRLKTLTIGYTFDKLKLLSPQFKIRLFAGAHNLFILTEYKGYDPEIAQGIDTGVYPTARSIYFGGSITF
ncbi:MAG: TonB-dependent receptor [Prevotellaceae bacterium]|jgi:TonB-linked SusC/RagA family outer membrane protein|nr:TonB-dependent receptor [Prevotellaceae bacterium]